MSEDDRVRARQRRSAIITALLLGAFAALMYAISIVKLSGGAS